MADVFTKEKRSLVMSHIRGTDTKLEIKVRRWLRSKGMGYRKNVASLPGKPDIVLSRYKCVIFINGCFWHGHANCRLFVIPKTHTDWWLNKISQTKKNDAHKRLQLEQKGWLVLNLWECELENDFLSVMDRVYSTIINNETD